MNFSTKLLITIALISLRAFEQVYSTTCKVKCTHLYDARTKEMLCKCKDGQATVDVEIPVSTYCSVNSGHDPLCDDKCSTLSYLKLLTTFTHHTDMVHVEHEGVDHLPDSFYEYQHTHHENEHDRSLHQSSDHEWLSHLHFGESSEEKEREAKRITRQVMNEIITSCEQKHKCSCGSIGMDDRDLSAVVYDEFWSGTDNHFPVHDEL